MTKRTYTHWEVIGKTPNDYGDSRLGPVKHKQYLDTEMSNSPPEEFMPKKIGGFLMGAFRFGILRNVRQVYSTKEEHQKDMHPMATLRDGRQYTLKENDMFFFLMGINAAIDVFGERFEALFDDKDLPMLREKIRKVLEQTDPESTWRSSQREYNFTPATSKTRTIQGKRRKQVESSSADEAVVKAAIDRMKLPDDDSWMNDLF